MPSIKKMKPQFNQPLRRGLNSLKTRHLHYKSHLATNIELFPPNPRTYCPIMFQCTKKDYIAVAKGLSKDTAQDFPPSLFI